MKRGYGLSNSSNSSNSSRAARGDARSPLNHHPPQVTKRGVVGVRRQWRVAGAALAAIGGVIGARRQAVVSGFVAGAGGGFGFRCKWGVIGARQPGARGGARGSFPTFTQLIRNRDWCQAATEGRWRSTGFQR